MSAPGQLAQRGDVRPPAPRADLSTFELDDDLVLYDPLNGQSFVLNATGRLVWSLCDGARSPLAIAGELAAGFGVEGEQALSDVDELLDNLRTAGLLEQND